MGDVWVYVASLVSFLAMVGLAIGVELMKRDLAVVGAFGKKILSGFFELVTAGVFLAILFVPFSVCLFLAVKETGTMTVGMFLLDYLGSGVVFVGSVFAGRFFRAFFKKLYNSKSA